MLTSRLHNSFLYQMFCFGHARDADVTFILFIRPHFMTFICLYAHNGKGSIYLGKRFIGTVMFCPLPYDAGMHVYMVSMAMCPFH